MVDGTWLRPKVDSYGGGESRLRLPSENNGGGFPGGGGARRLAAVGWRLCRGGGCCEGGSRVPKMAARAEGLARRLASSASNTRHHTGSEARARAVNTATIRISK